MMDLELNGRTVIVTGGSSGIGATCASRFLQEGARVAVWDVQATTLESSPDSLSVACDITDPDSVAAALHATCQRWERVDVLVHAAAIGSGYFGFPYLKVPPAAWTRVLQVNVLGMVHVAHAVGEVMVQQREGAMVFLASVAGQIGSQTDPPYSASKAANINFAQCLAKDLAPSGVRVNTVCPGMVQTPLNRSVWQAWHDAQAPEHQQSYEAWTKEKIQRMVPLGRWQEPNDIADMILFLSSRRAHQVTGQTINVDGGFVMHW